MVVFVVPVRGATEAPDSCVAPGAADMGAAKTASMSATTAAVAISDDARCAVHRRFLTCTKQPPGPGHRPMRDRGCPALGGRAMVRGSRSWEPSGGRESVPADFRCVLPPPDDGSGGVWAGAWADRRGWMTRNAHGPAGRHDRTVSSMQLITPPRPRGHVGSTVVGTLLGACFVAAGLSLGFLALQTPIVSGLIPGSRTDTLRVAMTFFVWALAMVAGASLVVAGTNRLAVAVASVRRRPQRRSPVVAALGSLPPDVVVATDVVPTEGRPIPELVVGPFGVAVIHELGKRNLPSARSGRPGSAGPATAGSRPSIRSTGRSATPNASAIG